MNAHLFVSYLLVSSDKSPVFINYWVQLRREASWYTLLKIWQSNNSKFLVPLPNCKIF